VGLAIAQQMMQQQGGALFSGTGATTAPAAPGLGELMSPAQAARALGVTEGDVMAVIESGELSAKKIGATYRIKRSALDTYLSD